MIATTDEDKIFNRLKYVQPIVGERWYVELPEQLHLMYCGICKVTSLVIRVYCYDRDCYITYKRDDLIFIEKAED